MKQLTITTKLVRALIINQFPQYKELDIRPVEFNGIDNRTFRLGDDLLVRLPSAKGYAPQVLKEQRWLPFIANHLEVEIPIPLHMGESGQDYPWNWSIYRWLPGTTLNQLDLSTFERETLAVDLAFFLKELQRVPIQDAPEGGIHNYYRGCHPSIYDEEARAAIERLKGFIHRDKACATWEAALSSKWEDDPVWLHGDMATGNIVMRNGKLSAVIDFGCSGTGDPACDLVIAWTYFENTARQLFKNPIELDCDTWSRARGWALWKASINLLGIENKSSPEALDQVKTINDIINDD